ncbi:hypothetical protein BDFB_013048 [Asbolus verrucosus]|uniref:Uncharacterized protein n=1 Tax=Asbolus verrucosus TaxID=1661398 RepID=A0A482WCC0_ASBVE|nr:hypothetical protein BDFB_013048 [Asbolus verrucosus]
MDSQTGLSPLDSRSNDVQYGRPLLGGACSTPSKLGPPYQARSALRRRFLRVPNVNASTNKYSYRTQGH